MSETRYQYALARRPHDGAHVLVGAGASQGYTLQDWVNKYSDEENWELLGVALDVGAFFLEPLFVTKVTEGDYYKT